MESRVFSKTRARYTPCVSMSLDSSSPPRYAVFVIMNRYNAPAPFTRIAGLCGILFLSSLPCSAFAKGLRTTPGLSPDQYGLAVALNRKCQTAPGQAGAICDALHEEDGRMGTATLVDGQTLTNTLASLSPAQFLPQTAVPLKVWPKQISTRSTHPGVAGDAEDLRTGSGGNSGDIGGGDGPFGYFVQTKYQAGAYHGDAFRFEADAYTLTAGADYRVSDRLLTGIAAVYTRQETFMHGNPGYMQTNAYRAAWFGNYYLPMDFYLGWLGTYSRHDNRLRREYSVLGLSGSAHSKPVNDLYSGSLTLGRDMAFQQWLVTSYLRTEYMNIHVHAHSERDNLSLAYEVGGQSDQSLTMIPGFQISRAFSLSWGVLTPSLRFEYEHQFLNDDRRIPLRFVGPGSTPFFLSSGQPDRDYCNLGGGLSATLPGGGAAFLRYEARLAQQSISNHIVEIGVRMPF